MYVHVHNHSFNDLRLKHTQSNINTQVFTLSHFHTHTHKNALTHTLTKSTVYLCIVDVCWMHRGLLHWLLCQISSEGGTEAPQNDPHAGELCRSSIRSISSPCYICVSLFLSVSLSLSQILSIISLLIPSSFCFTHSFSCISCIPDSYLILSSFPSFSASAPHLTFTHTHTHTIK